MPPKKRTNRDFVHSNDWYVIVAPQELQIVGTMSNGGRECRRNTGSYLIKIERLRVYQAHAVQRAAHFVAIIDALLGCTELPLLLNRNRLFCRRHLILLLEWLAQLLGLPVMCELLGLSNLRGRHLSLSLRAHFAGIDAHVAVARGG
jgi:hypothetical protein